MSKLIEEGVAEYFNMSEDEWNTRSTNVNTRESAEEEWISSNIMFNHQDSVLDFACGIGRYIDMLAHRVKEIVAIDQARNLIDTINKQQYKNVFAHTGDQSSIEKYRDKFDKCLFCQSLEFFNNESLAATLKLINNSLKNEGTIVISSWTKDLIRSKMVDDYVYPQKPNENKKVKLFFKPRSENELRSLLHDSGFVNIQIEELTKVINEKNQKLLIVAKATKL